MPPGDGKNQPQPNPFYRPRARSQGCPAPGVRKAPPAGASAIDGVPFDSYVLIANPGYQTANVEVRFLGASGQITQINPPPLVGPRSRKTIKIGDFVSSGHPQAGSISTIVSYLNGVPVLCERAMYWPKGGASVWTDGHATVEIAESQ